MATASETRDAAVQAKNSTRVVYYATTHAAGATTTETIMTLNKSSGTSAVTSGTSFTIPTKNFRITSISIATRGHNTATAQTTTFNLRVNTAGATDATSTPIVWSARSATPATANAWDRHSTTIPEGILEFVGNGTITFGMSAAATYTTNAPTWDVAIVGYEY